MAEFFLSGNPLSCDCEMDWLPGVNAASATSGGDSRNPRVADLADLECSVDLGKAEDGRFKVAWLPKEDFLCQYQTHCFALCMCCDFFACDCRMQCPEGCSCHHDSSWSQNVIRCSERGLRAVPALIPMDATEVRHMATFDFF